MKTHYKKAIIILFFIAVTGNIAIFISSMKLSTEIHTYEQKTYQLSQENIQREKEMADTESFIHAKEYQTLWGFERATKPVFIGDLPMALNTKR